jgi:hypothetical protein
MLEFMKLGFKQAAFGGDSGGGGGGGGSDDSNNPSNYFEDRDGDGVPNIFDFDDGVGWADTSAPDTGGGSDDNDDGPTFGEAFAAARAAQGAGGTFTWNGQVYTTNTAEEEQAAADAQAEATRQALLEAQMEQDRKTRAASEAAAVEADRIAKEEAAASFEEEAEADDIDRLPDVMTVPDFGDSDTEGLLDFQEQQDQAYQDMLDRAEAAEELRTGQTDPGDLFEQLYGVDPDTVTSEQLQTFSPDQLADFLLATGRTDFAGDLLNVAPGAVLPPVDGGSAAITEQFPPGTVGTEVQESYQPSELETLLEASPEARTLYRDLGIERRLRVSTPSDPTSGQFSYYDAAGNPLTEAQVRDLLAGAETVTVPGGTTVVRPIDVIDPGVTGTSPAVTPVDIEERDPLDIFLISSEEMDALRERDRQRELETGMTPRTDLDTSGGIESLLPPTTTTPAAGGSPSPTLTRVEVVEAIQDELANLDTATPDQVQDIVNNAIANNPTLTSDEVEQIVNDAVSTLPNITSEDVTNIVNSATTAQEEAILSQVGQQISGVETSLLGRIEQLQSEGQTADEALNTALGELETQLGVNREELLGELETTEQAILGRIGTQISDVETSLLNRIQELQSAGQTADQALNTALGELETQLGTTRQDLLGTIGETEQSILDQVGTQISGVETTLLNRIQELQSAGQTADQALNTALGELETQLGTTRQDLLGTIGETEQSILDQVGSQISGVEGQLENLETQVDRRFQELVEAGEDTEAALNAAIDSVAGDLGQTREELLAQLGVTEQELSTRVSEVESSLRGEIGVVAETVGRPARDVTQADIDALNGLLMAGDIANPTAQQRGYDVDGDGQVTAADLDIMTRFSAGEDVSLAPTSAFGSGTGLWSGQNLSRNQTGESAPGYTGTALPGIPGTPALGPGIRPGGGGIGTLPGFGTGTGTGTGVGAGAGAEDVEVEVGGPSDEGQDQVTGTPVVDIECPPGYQKVTLPNGQVACQPTADVMRPKVAPYLQTGPGPAYNPMPYAPVPYQDPSRPLPAPGYTPFRPGGQQQIGINPPRES